MQLKRPIRTTRTHMDHMYGSAYRPQNLMFLLYLHSIQKCKQTSVVSVKYQTTMILTFIGRPIFGFNAQPLNNRRCSIHCIYIYVFN